MPTYTPLQSIELTTATTDITFSNISQSYQDLVLVISSITTNNIQLYTRVNGDTGNNYSNTLLGSNGSSASSTRQATAGNIQSDYFLASSANGGISVLNFMNYSNTTTFKTVLGRSGLGSSPAGTGGVNMVSNLWRNTAAINSINVRVVSDSFAAGSKFDLYGISPVAANNAQAFGGTDIYYDSTYVYHVFKGSGTFTPYRNLTADVLCLAGGGGGGVNGAGVGGGGGGAGGLTYYSSQSLISGTNYSVTIGAGGTGGTQSPFTSNNGNNSQFASLTASVGGGRGGQGGATGGSANGGNGGSGGGAAYIATGTKGLIGTGTAGQGNNGGDTIASPATDGSGGGGGVSAAGANSTASSGGNGGSGTSSYSSWGSATGTGQLVSSTYYYGGGGGGGGRSSNATAAGSGGFGGGGAGATNNNGSSGNTNTGSGGGGAGGDVSTYYGGNGGSGLIIVRYAR